MTTATLLFCHGGGFCKEAWDPIIRRVRASALLKRTPVEIVSFDFPFHGPKRDVSVAAELHLENPESPRVTHPGNAWIEYAAGEVRRQVAMLAERKPKAPLIGIGHSMGAVALWTTEVRYPGTFDGLILFEPIHMVGDKIETRSIDFLTKLTLQRESQWSSREEAEAHIRGRREFANWDDESLAAYLKGALVQDADGSTVLACHPHIEAAFYCGKQLSFSDEQLAKPKCSISFHSGKRTQLFKHWFHDSLAERFPHIYKNVAPIPETSHVMVLEDPTTSASRILDDLAQLPPFKDAAAAGSNTAASRL